MLRRELADFGENLPHFPDLNPFQGHSSWLLRRKSWRSNPDGNKYWRLWKIAVSKPFLNLFHRNAICQQQAGTGMTQVVKSNWPQTKVTEDQFERVRDIVRHEQISHCIHADILQIKRAINSESGPLFQKEFSFLFFDISINLLYGFTYHRVKNRRSSNRQKSTKKGADIFCTVCPLPSSLEEIWNLWSCCCVAEIELKW